jgi:MFS transporter, DHA1 family, multidrug resistance protein
LKDEKDKNMLAWQKTDRMTILILTPLVLSVALSMDIYIPSLGHIMQVFSVDTETVQWTLSIYMLGLGVSQLLCGSLTDRFGRRPVVLIGLIIYFVGTCVCVSSVSIMMLIMGRLLQSIGSCAAIVVAYAVVKDLYSVRQSARMYNYLHSITMIAPMLAPMLGGYLSDYCGGWRAAFVFLLVFGLVSFGVCFFLLSETLETKNRVAIHPSNIASHFGIILKNKKFIVNAFYMLTALSILFCFCGVSSFLLINILGVSKNMYGLCFGSNALFFILGAYLCLQWEKRWGLKGPLSVGIGCVLLGAVSLLLGAFYGGLTLLYFMLPIYSVTCGLGFIMGPATARALEDFGSLAGTAAALLASIQFLGAGLIGSLVLSMTVSTAIPFAMSILCLGLISCLLHRYFAPSLRAMESRRRRVVRGSHPIFKREKF